MADSPKETYLVATTASEPAELWLVQTDEYSKLINNLFAECGGRLRAVVFKLSLATVQKNNCFGGQLLTTVVDINPAEAFHLHIQEAVHHCIWRAKLEDRPALLEAAIVRLSAELTRHKEDLKAQKNKTNEQPTGS